MTSLERALFLALRRQVERRVALADRDAEQRGDQRHRLIGATRCARSTTRNANGGCGRRERNHLQNLRQ
jgi:hypothetical protein